MLVLAYKSIYHQHSIISQKKLLGYKPEHAMSLLKTLWILPFVFGMNSKLSLKVPNDSTLLLWPCFFHTTLGLASHVPSPWPYFGSRNTPGSSTQHNFFHCLCALSPALYMTGSSLFRTWLKCSLLRETFSE